MNANELASELARRCEDSEADDGLDMDIAQASHAVRVLSEICRENPAGVWLGLGNEYVCKECLLPAGGDEG